MERFPEERSVRGKIVVKGDGSRHLVVRTFAHAVKGRMLGLLSLDGEASEETPDSVSVLREPSDGGNGSLLRVLLANRKAQESGGGGLSLRCNTMFKAFQFRPLVKFQGEARGNLPSISSMPLAFRPHLGHLAHISYGVNCSGRSEV